MRQNFNTLGWGAGTWSILENMTLNFPMFPTENAKMRTKRFIVAIMHILPCGECREHAAIYIRANLTEEMFANRDKLRRFIFDFHNFVNQRVGKEKYSYELFLKQVPKLSWITLFFITAAYPTMPSSEEKAAFITFYDEIGHMMKIDFNLKVPTLEGLYEIYRHNAPKKNAMEFISIVNFIDSYKSS